jgi:hypothetical protein
VPPLLALALAASPAAPPLFVAHASGSEPQPGRLVSLSDFGATLAEPDAKIDPGRLVSLRRAETPLPPWPREPHVVLANGDRLAGTVTAGDGLRVRFAPKEKLADGWVLPLTALAAWWATAPPADAPSDPAKYPWAAPKRDTVLLRNGDTLSGSVESVSADGSTLRLVGEPGQPPRAVDLADVAAVAFDPALARIRMPKGAHARIVTAGGSRLTLSAAGSDGTTLTGTAPFGGKASLPVADLVALDVFQGKAAYLSDLKPKKTEIEGFNGVGWPVAVDRSAKGNPLRLPGTTAASWCDKGLGTHPKTTLTYDLGGRYRHFEAGVGLDPVTGRRGTADVRILVDGKDRPVPGLKTLTAATSPVSVRLDIAGAKELTLVIDFGPGGDVQADVNWADARLVE